MRYVVVVIGLLVAGCGQTTNSTPVGPSAPGAALAPPTVSTTQRAMNTTCAACAWWTTNGRTVTIYFGPEWRARQLDIVIYRVEGDHERQVATPFVDLGRAYIDWVGESGVYRGVVTRQDTPTNQVTILYFSLGGGQAPSTGCDDDCEERGQDGHGGSGGPDGPDGHEGGACDAVHGRGSANSAPLGSKKPDPQPCHGRDDEHGHA